MRVLVTSEHDIASQTMWDILVNSYRFTETDQKFEDHPVMVDDKGSLLIQSQKDLIDCGHLESHFDAEAFIFCSRHRAQSGQPALLVHSTGNLGMEALFGGDSQSLSISSATLVSTALRVLQKEKENRGLGEFDVTLEVTHHGPTKMDTPLVFVELGSDENYWRHEEGARAVVAAAVECLYTPFEEEACIGFGGSHYAKKFNKLVLEKDINMGHMAPKHTLEELTPTVISQMISRCNESVKSAIIDWKGTNSEQRNHILPILEEMGLEVLRAKHL